MPGGSTTTAPVAKLYAHVQPGDLQPSGAATFDVRISVVSPQITDFFNGGRTRPISLGGCLLGNRAFQINAWARPRQTLNNGKNQELRFMSRRLLQTCWSADSLGLLLLGLTRKSIGEKHMALRLYW